MRISISKILIVFGLVVSSGLLIAMAVQNYTLQKLKVRGSEYTQIIFGKDLIADILPPPLYVIEAYLLATEGIYHSERSQENQKKIAALKEAYEQRKTYWAGSDLDQGVNASLTQGVIATGDAFWQLYQSDMLPAMQSTDPDVHMAALDKMMAAYYTHQKAVYDTVAIANSYLSKAESKADNLTATLTPLALGTGVASILLFLAGLAFVRRRAIQPLDGMKAYMANLAEGDYSKSVPYADRQDEIGSMSRAVAVFRENAMERQQNRLRATQARDAELERERQVAAERAAADEERRKVIASLTEGLEHLSHGNLAYRIDQPFAETYEKLRREFNTSITTLARSLGEIATTTNTVRESSAEIARATEDLAKRTEEQARTIEGTAAALDEITATVRNSSNRAQEASAMMSATRSSATKSAEVMQEAMSAMERIAGSSSQISQILNVIDEIAFQTNLLALNAGVEAARAGDAGKGFAVVAQEVRDLASRSANAAKEIKTLISTSSAEVSGGVALVNRTGETLGEIEGQVRRVTDLIDEIVTGSAEQAVAIGEINSAVNRMDQVTQQNASMSEQTWAACRALNGEAQTLEQVVGHFRLADRPTAPRPTSLAETARRNDSPAPAARATPTPSPARALGNRLSKAFGGSSAAATTGWEEF